MRVAKKLLLASALAAVLSISVGVPLAAAQGILPAPDSQENCDDYKKGKRSSLESEEGFKTALNETQGKDEEETITKSQKLRNLLGCAVKLGKIKLFMMPFFIVYLIEFLLGIAGLLAVLYVVYGGFLYIWGGVSDEKEKGKNAIKHALMGLVVALGAWIIVNFIQVALTS